VDYLFFNVGVAFLRLIDNLGFEIDNLGFYLFLHFLGYLLGFFGNPYGD